MATARFVAVANYYLDIKSPVPRAPHAISALPNGSKTAVNN
jgi:hypothetical protein